MSIFAKVHKLNINNEYNKIVEGLFKSRYYFNNYAQSFIEHIDGSGVFKEWAYRDTCLTINDYLIHLDISFDNGTMKRSVTVDEFLFFAEFMVNIIDFSFHKTKVNVNQYVKPFFENLLLVVNKMGYYFHHDEDRLILTIKDEDLHSIIEEVDEDIAELLIKYKAFSIRDNLEEKRNILKKLDLKIEEDKSHFSSISKNDYSLINKVVNNFGINHPMKFKLSDSELIEIYDKCFLVVIQLFRRDCIIDYNNEIKHILAEKLGK